MEKNRFKGVYSDVQVDRLRERPSAGSSKEEMEAGFDRISRLRKVKVNFP